VGWRLGWLVDGGLVGWRPGSLIGSNLACLWCGGCGHAGQRPGGPERYGAWWSSSAVAQLISSSVYLKDRCTTEHRYGRPVEHRPLGSAGLGPGRVVAGLVVAW
jgi:hypothetical protein